MLAELFAAASPVATAPTLDEAVEDCHLTHCRRWLRGRVQFAGRTLDDRGLGSALSTGLPREICGRYRSKSMGGAQSGQNSSEDG